jgi:hypothetical protein
MLNKTDVAKEATLKAIDKGKENAAAAIADSKEATGKAMDKASEHASSISSVHAKCLIGR